MKIAIFAGILFSVFSQASTLWSGYHAQLRNDLGILDYKVQLVQKVAAANKVVLKLSTNEKNSNTTFDVKLSDFEKALNIFKNCTSKKLGKIVIVKTQAGEFEACRVKTVTDDRFLEHTAWYIDGLWIPVKSVYRYDRQRKLGQVEEVVALF